ncbi:unnamed protein product [Caenorhabditis auriculariae]|uniref:Uncharacterized protein n=1 Tax=Caenorhabditis auriculariae TaxID=2777116 RepID=A0A8S1HS44_9PELO|nr:unnamed protein product [Caenorhabditis auriculariae]
MKKDVISAKLESFSPHWHDGAIKPSLPSPEMEDFDAYRAMCANRLRRLERYKKARSFCNLEFDEGAAAKMVDEPCTTMASPSSEESTTSSEPSTFDQIREKMFSLMENDMSLLQQLLTLGDQINEMKKHGLRRTVSTGSIDYEEEEKGDHFDEGFSASMSAVTTLYVDDEQPQFFSRQNSVLRIPIPPRSSNRFGPRRVIRRPSDVLRQQQPTGVRRLHINSDDTGSDSSDGAQSPQGAVSSGSVSYSTSNASTISIASAKKNRSSNSSIDSGIRDENSPSPTFEREVA